MALLLAALAFTLRLRAANLLPIDFDEDDYLLASEQIATALRQGEWTQLRELNYRPEHPQLMKTLFALALAPLPPAPALPDPDTAAQPVPALPQPHLLTGRLVSAVFGTLAVLALALIQPLAGLFLAGHTYTIKYTSQMMLEGLPLLTGIVAVWAFDRSQVWRQEKPGWTWWLALSGMALGLTAAAKYNYAICGLAILGFWLTYQMGHRYKERRSRLGRRLALALAWGMLALLTFIAVLPYLWPDPAGRLLDSIFFHAAYPFSEHVQSSGYSIFQPLIWLSTSVPWHPAVFPVGFDGFISLLALFGLPRLIRERPIYAWWLAAGLMLLFIWPTKWPQYILILITPVTLAAGLATMQIGQSLLARVRPATEQADLDT